MTNEWLNEKALQPHEIQGSQEWLLHRKSRIGASDVPAILGNCDFRTAKDIFDDKIGTDTKDISGEWQIIRGHSLETVSIARFESLHNCRLTKPLFSYPKWPVLHCSLDGWWEEERTVIECKAPAVWKHTMALCGLVPDTYVDQLQAQMLVTESDSLRYVSYHDGLPEGFDYAEVIVRRDEARCVEIEKVCQKFWAMVLKKEWDENWND